MLTLTSFEKDFAGVVSEDTLKTEILVSTFKQILTWLVKYDAEGVIDEDYDLILYQGYDEEHLDIFFNRLDDIASHYGYTFSAHPDDGACFGFWRIEE